MNSIDEETMKVVIHTMYYLPEFGSAPILMNELAEYLAGRGHEVEVVTTIPRPPHHKPYRGKLFHREDNQGYVVKRYRTNFTVHHIGRLIAWTLFTAQTIVNLRHAGPGDVIFLRLPPLQLGLTGYFARKLKGAKVLLSVQDIHPDLSIESGLLKNPRLIRLAQRLEKWIYKQGDRIAVISRGFEDNLSAKGVPREKLSIVPNWVDTDALRPVPKDNGVARKFQLQNKFVAMYSGTITLSSYVTLEKLLEAAGTLGSRERDFRLVIVGEGLKKNDLIRKAETLGLDNVLFLPFQPYEDLPELLGASDVLLVPLDREKTQLSVPSKLYNYLAAGRPVLALADESSEVVRIIREGDCGLWAEPEDVEDIAGKMMRLKSRPDLIEILGAHARDHCIEHYSKNKVLQSYEDLMRSLNPRSTGLGEPSVLNPGNR